MSRDFNSPIILVASGMYKLKKEFMKSPVQSMYLNFGLLGLATKLSSKGFENVGMFQGDFKNISEIISEIESCGFKFQRIKHPVLVSVPSFFAIDWANDFIKAVKNINSKLKIIVGGRWVINANIDWIKSKMPDVDFFVWAVLMML